MYKVIKLVHDGTLISNGVIRDLLIRFIIGDFSLKCRVGVLFDFRMYREIVKYYYRLLRISFKRVGVYNFNKKLIHGKEVSCDIPKDAFWRRGKVIIFQYS